jgi:hypothetical protein
VAGPACSAFVFLAAGGLAEAPPVPLVLKGEGSTSWNLLDFEFMQGLCMDCGVSQALVAVGRAAGPEGHDAQYPLHMCGGYAATCFLGRTASRGL